MHFFIFMLHFWAVIIKTICPYTNYVKNKTKMFIFNLFSSAFLIFNFLRFLPCILLQRLFYYGSEAIEWFILLKYCVNTFDFSLATYLDLVLTQKNRTKLSFIQCTVRWWLHIGGSKMFEPLFRAEMSFLNHFFCKIFVFHLSKLNFRCRFLRWSAD